MPTEEDIDRALRWLDLYFQNKGQFGVSAKVQARTPHFMGLAPLMARYLNEEKTK